jgi:hypothetical protein
MVFAVKRPGEDLPAIFDADDGGLARGTRVPNLDDAWIKTGFFEPISSLDTHAEYESYSGDVMSRLRARSSWSTWQSWYGRALRT